MADDDTGETSSPWGRSRRTPGQPTPAPGSTPPPGSAGTPAPTGPSSTPPGPFEVPGTPPPPSGPFAVPGTPAPPPGTPAPPFSLDKADPPATTVTPAEQWASPPTSPPGYGAPGYGPGGYGGTPPPGYPPGGYPPGGPVPAKKGSGVVLVLIAVGVVALLLVGAVVALVVLSGDDEPDRASNRTAGPATAPTTVAPGSTELPGSSELPGSTEPPATTEAPGSTEVPPTTGPGTPTLPPSGASAPPEDFPDPAGATDSVTGGIEVPGMTAQQVADFYEAELPGAGYTVDQVQDVGGIFVITVSGPATGVLSITSFDPLPTTVLWSGF